MARKKDKAPAADDGSAAAAAEPAAAAGSAEDGRKMDATQSAGAAAKPAAGRGRHRRKRLMPIRVLIRSGSMQQDVAAQIFGVHCVSAAMSIAIYGVMHSLVYAIVSVVGVAYNDEATKVMTAVVSLSMSLAVLFASVLGIVALCMLQRRPVAVYALLTAVYFVASVAFVLFCVIKSMHYMALLWWAPVPIYGMNVPVMYKCAHFVSYWKPPAAGALTVEAANDKVD